MTIFINEIPIAIISFDYIPEIIYGISDINNYKKWDQWIKLSFETKHNIEIFNSIFLDQMIINNEYYSEDFNREIFILFFNMFP